MALRRKEISLEDVWPGLRECIEQMLKDHLAPMEPKYYMENYSKVVDYCMYASSKGNATSSNGAHCGGEQLYDKVKLTLQQHLKDLFEGTRGLVGDQLISFYYRHFESFTTSIKRVNALLNYLNRYWIKAERSNKNRDVYELYPLSLVIWREVIFEQINERITEAALDQIYRARQGEQITTSVLKGVIDSFVDIGLTKESPDQTNLRNYQTFETEFLTRTEIFYTQESSQFVESNSISDYMKKVESRLAEETRRREAILHQSTEPELMKRLELVLIEKHVEGMQNEFSDLLKQEKIDDLLRMYSLLSRVDALNPMRTEFEKHVIAEGGSAITKIAQDASKNPKLYVEELLNIWRKFHDFVVGPFKNESGFVQALDKACRRFINTNAVTELLKDPRRSPELIAKYSDQLLQKSNKDSSLQVLEPLLTDIITIFQYVESKDVFMTYYSKNLARRLIDGKSASEDAERIMIEKLKDACGFQFISKLQRMFNDMTISRELQEGFFTEGAKLPDGISFEVLVLSNGAWPLSQSANTTFDPPQVLKDFERAFSDFYEKRQPNKELVFLHQYSKNTIKTGCYHRPYQLMTSSYQYAVLDQFNRAAVRTYEQLQVATNLDPYSLKQTVVSLLKSRVIKSDPLLYEKKTVDGKETVEWAKEIASGTRFAIQTKFQNKQVKVNIISQIKDEEKKAGGSSVSPQIEAERRARTEAAIVRIMKMRKELPHNTLLTEVHDQLKNRFPPEVGMIKTSIDGLIEKEYLERIPEKRGWYRYLA